MAAKQQRCPHHEHKSREMFVKHIKSLIGMCERSDLERSRNRILGDLSDKLNGGLCHQCTIQTFPHVVSVIDKTEFDYKGFIMAASYLLYSLEYPFIAKFIFHQSRLWLVLFGLYFWCLGSIKSACQQTEHSNTNFVSSINIRSRLHLLCQSGSQLCYFMSLMKKHHWHILLEKPGSSEICCFDYLLDFVEYQLQTGFYLNDDDEQNLLSEVMQYLLVLILFGANYLKMHSHEYKHSVQYLRRIGRVLEHSEALTGFDCIIKIDDLSSLHSTLHGPASVLWNQKWMNMKCARIGCKVRRIDNDKLYKCKKCKVVRYCSKRCQKIDWNMNDHKKHCRMLRKIKISH